MKLDRPCLPHPLPPAPPFSIVYADPPWRFRGGNARKVAAATAPLRKGDRNPPYPCLSTDAICALPVAGLCARDCVLFLWATYPLLPDALQVIAAWGFTFKTVAFTWAKQNPSGVGWHMGLGHWTRANPELCLLATRGKPKRQDKAVANLVAAPRREHSRKPDEVRERIVALCGDLPRAELFARQKMEGWCAWGNEVDSDFILPLPY